MVIKGALTVIPTYAYVHLKLLLFYLPGNVLSFTGVWKRLDPPSQILFFLLPNSDMHML